MEKDILNYSPTVMFRGTPCTLKQSSKLIYQKSKLCISREGLRDGFPNNSKTSEFIIFFNALFHDIKRLGGGGGDAPD